MEGSDADRQERSCSNAKAHLSYPSPKFLFLVFVVWEHGRLAATLRSCVVPSLRSVLLDSVVSTLCVLEAVCMISPGDFAAPDSVADSVLPQSSQPKQGWVK